MPIYVTKKDKRNPLVNLSLKTTKDKIALIIHRNETISNSIFIDDEFEFSKFRFFYIFVFSRRFWTV